MEIVQSLLKNHVESLINKCGINIICLGIISMFFLLLIIFISSFALDVSICTLGSDTVESFGLVKVLDLICQSVAIIQQRKWLLLCANIFFVMLWPSLISNASKNI